MGTPAGGAAGCCSPRLRQDQRHRCRQGLDRQHGAEPAGADAGEGRCRFLRHLHGDQLRQPHRHEARSAQGLPLVLFLRLRHRSLFERHHGLEGAAQREAEGGRRSRARAQPRHDRSRRRSGGGGQGDDESRAADERGYRDQAARLRAQDAFRLQGNRRQRPWRCHRRAHGEVDQASGRHLQAAEHADGQGRVRPLVPAAEERAHAQAQAM